MTTALQIEFDTLISNYKTKLKTMKENQSESFDNNTDDQNHSIEFELRLVASFIRDLNKLKRIYEK